MKIQFTDKKLNQIKADFEVVLVVNKNLKHKWVSDQKDLDIQNFKGDEGEAAVLFNKKKLYLGVKDLDNDTLRVAAAQIIQVLKKTKIKDLKMNIYGSARALTEGFILGSYSFEMYKSKKNKLSLNKIYLSKETYDGKEVNAKAVNKEIKEAEIIAESTNYTREIVNQIPAEITPLKMSEIAKELAQKNGLDIKVYGEKYLEKEGMGAFLAVSKASPYPPQLIHLTYKPENPKAKIAVVGKGLTYDSGGLSLKPSDSMVTMKSDKSGASAVFGIMQAVSKLKLPIEVHGIVGAVENMIGKHAYKPDDVLRAKNGKTIEINNTDAEGRLVLADCLCYAQEFKPDYIVDLATLTGACVVALGEYTVGVMGFNNDLKNNMMQAAETAGELTGNLPFNKYLGKLLKSEVADMSNCATVRYGGAITAGLFLSEFVDNKYHDKWLHLDIAGPAFVKQPWGYNPYGASGAGVRMVVQWINNLLEE